MRSYTKVNDQTLNMTVKKGSRVMGTGRIAVSADGKSRVVTVNGTTAKGKKFSNTVVYDRENSLGQGLTLTGTPWASL